MIMTSKSYLSNAAFILGFLISFLTQHGWSQGQAEKTINRQAILNQKSLKEIFENYAAQAAHCFKYLNEDSKIPLNELKSALKTQIYELAQSREVPEDLNNNGAPPTSAELRFMHDLYAEAFKPLLISGDVTQLEFSKFVKDTDLIERHFRQFCAKMSVFTLLQYIPLTKKQIENVIGGIQINDSESVSPFSYTMNLVNGSPEKTLSMFDLTKIKPPLSGPQQKLLDKLMGESTERRAPYADLSLSVSALRQVNTTNKKSMPDPLPGRFLKDYYATQIKIWADEFGLNPADQKKLNIVSGQSVDQLLTFYSDPEKLDLSKAYNHEMLSQSITHVSFNWKKWVKILNKISNSMIDRGSKSFETPIDYNNKYYSLIYDMNLDFIITALRLCGNPKVDLQAASHGLTGKQIFEIKQVFSKANGDQPTLYLQDFNFLRNIIIGERAKFESILTPGQMDALKVLGEGLDMETELK